MVDDMDVDKVADKVVDMVADMAADNKNNNGDQHGGGQGGRQGGRHGGQHGGRQKKLRVPNLARRRKKGTHFGERVGHGGWLIGPKISRPKAYPTCVS